MARFQATLISGNSVRKCTASRLFFKKIIYIFTDGNKNLMVQCIAVYRTIIKQEGTKLKILKKK